MVQSKSKNLLLGMAVASLLGTLSSATLAQVTVEVSDAPASSGQVEELIVTGTSIRGIAPIGSAPISYGRADIENDAPVDIRDALSNVPQISNFGTDADQSTSQRFRTSGYQPIIHNLGIYSTLTLFNGHRMADVGGEAVFPDPSILPTIAVQRAEVIADGSSAIYGADAVAGVINMIYRRGVDGLEVSATRGTDPETSWENTNAALLWGNVFDRGEVMVAYEHSQHLRPTEDEFPFARERDKRDIGLSDFRGTNCIPPRVRFDGVDYSGPDLATNASQGGAYRCNPHYYGSVAANGERDAALVTARYSLTDSVELWAEGNYSDYNTWQDASYGNYTLIVPSSSPFFIVPPGADPTGVTSERVQGTYGDYFGVRRRPGSSKVMGWTLGADIDIGGGWQTNVMLHASKTLDYNDSLTIDSVLLEELTLAGEYNPFDQSVGGNDPSIRDQVLNGFTQLNDTSQSLRELSIKADGPVFSISGGDVMAAVGASYRGQRARQIQSAGCEDGCSFYMLVRDDDISRGVNAVFGELAIPLVGGANARPGIEELSISFAGRYDKYDGLPGQFSPKAGFTWIPMQGLDVHGTWGESYTAPNIGLTTSTFGVPQTQTDGVGAHLGGEPGVNYALDIYNRGGGSPAVEPEDAKSWSLGFTYEPEFAQGLSAGVTYYRVEYSNLIYKPGRGDVLDNPLFSEFVQMGEYDDVNNVFLPLDQAIVDNLIATEPPQTPIAPGQTFNMWFVSYAVNIGTRIHAGLDYNINYDFDTAIGQWSLGMVANQQLTYDEQPDPSQAFFSRMNTGDAQEWQTRLQTRWTSNDLPLSVTLISNFRSGYDLTDGNGSVDGRWVHNLTASYEIEELFNGVTLQARVRNLMDEPPPFINSGVGYDEDTSSPYGRQMDLTVRARF